MTLPLMHTYSTRSVGCAGSGRMMRPAANNDSPANPNAAAFNNDLIGASRIRVARAGFGWPDA